MKATEPEGHTLTPCRKSVKGSAIRHDRINANDLPTDAFRHKQEMILHINWILKLFNRNSSISQLSIGIYHPEPRKPGRMIDSQPQLYCHGALLHKSRAVIQPLF